MRIHNLLLAAALFGCKGGGADTDTDPVQQWPPTKPYQTHGDEGSIVLVSLDRPEGPRIDVYGLFADDLQGFETGAACAQEKLPCVSGIGEVDEDEEGTDQHIRANNRRFQLTQAKSRWVGDRLSAGPVFAELVHRVDDRIAWYRGSEDQAPQQPFRLRFGGEWAQFDQVTAPFPDPFTVVEPMLQLGERLDLSQESIDFRWISDHQQEVWLWVQGPDTKQFFNLVDDGYFELEPRDLGLEPAEVVEVGLAAVNRDSVDVDGNLLDVLVIDGSGWKGSRCDFLDVGVTNTPPEGEMEHPVFYGFQFQGIIDDGLHDYFDPQTGQAESAKLLFTFYDQFLQPICEIEYDASDGGRSTPLISDSGGVIYDSYRVGLFNGRSTCGLVDPSVTGFADLRNWLEQFDWGFGLGELNELAEPLQAAIELNGGSWETSEPAIYAVYWTQDGLFGDEQGYGYQSRLTTCNQPSQGVEPRVDDGELDVGYYFTYPYYIQPILQ